MEEISRELKEFIQSNFPRIEALRIFLLLRSTREKKWNVERLSVMLFAPPELVSDHLKLLGQKGFVRFRDDGSVQYRPQPSMEDLCEKLVQLDREKPVTLIRFIYLNKDTSNRRE